MPSPKRVVWKDGTVVWRVRFRHRGRDTSETFITKREAAVFCRDIEDHGADYAVSLRDAEDDVKASPFMDDLADRFFEWKAPRSRSDRTVADYRRDYAKAIAPTFGRMPVAAITEADVQGWIDGMVSGRAAVHVTRDGRRQALNPKTIGDRHALLHSIIKFGMGPAGGRVVDVDPCASVELPRRRRRPPKGLRPAEWQALYAAMRQIAPDAADLALFMIASGWRWSEATALDAWSVDDDGTHVTVTMGRVFRRNAAGATVIVEDGKAEASLRRVRLDRDTSAMIRRRMIANADDGLIFRTPVSPQNGLGGNPWNYSGFLRVAWNPAVEVANLSRRPTPHWLRHTHVAWMVAAGAKLPEIQARIGHASITTTISVYGSMVTDVSPDTLATFAGALGTAQAISADSASASNAAG